MSKLTLYHNTSNTNAINISKEGIKAGMRLNVYGKGSEAEGSGIWCSTVRGYGYGGATITFKIDDTDKDLWKANDTEYIVYRDIDVTDIIDIDLMISDIPCNPNRLDRTNSTVESDIPLAIQKWGRNNLINIFEKNSNHFVQPYNLEQLVHLIDTGEKYCRIKSNINEDRKFTPTKLIDTSKLPSFEYEIEARSDSDDYKNIYKKYKNSKSKKIRCNGYELDCISAMYNNEYYEEEFPNVSKLLYESKSKIEEVSRNELLTRAKQQTITRYNKSVGYKGFSIVDIDTTSVFTTNCFRVTCGVGKYYDTVEMENILYWVQIEAEKDKSRQINSKGVTAAIMNSIDGMDIRIDCSCPDFCLEGSTLIKLLNGEVVPVSELKTRYDAGEELWVYSTDEKGDFKPGRVNDVWISGKVSKLIKVTLDNGKSIITTLNHKYMMRDGAYKEACELELKDSLMPLYFSYHNGYECVKRNSKKDGTVFDSVYKIVADTVLGEQINEAKSRSNEKVIQIHHKDFNKLNNYPSNLYPMGKQEHWMYHAKLGKEHISNFIKAGRDFWETDPRRFEAKEKQRQRARDYQIQMWSNFTPEERANYIAKSRVIVDKQKLSDAQKKVWGSYTEEERLNRLKTSNLFVINNPMKDPNYLNSDDMLERNKKVSEGLTNYYATKSKEELAVIYGKSMRGKKRSENAKRKTSESLKEYYKNHPITDERRQMYRERGIQSAYKVKLSKCKRNLDQLVQSGVIITEDTFLENRLHGDPHWNKVFNTFDEMLNYFQIPVALNHKVTKIEIIDYNELVDVFDISVENYHNFYVDAGVVLHNCYRFAYRATKYKYKYGKPETRPADKTNPNEYGALCKHQISMLSNKKWLQQATSVLLDYLIERIDDVNKFLKLSGEDVLTVPNELARQNARKATYSKLFKDVDNEDDVDDIELNSDNDVDDENVDKPEQNVQINKPQGASIKSDRDIDINEEETENEE